MTGQNLEWHRKVIPASTEECLRALKGAGALDGFYLAGGTGLALQFGHRLSLDLDFFCSDPFDEAALVQRIEALSGFALVSRAPQTLHATVESTKVSFLGYKYPVLYPASSFLDVPVADPHDIACMKVSVLSARGAKRDFIDLYYCAQRYGLAEILALFERKYEQAHCSKVHVLKSLTYFADAVKEPMPHMLVPLAWNEVELFFRREVPRLI